MTVNLSMMKTKQNLQIMHFVTSLTMPQQHMNLEKEFRLHRKALEAMNTHLAKLQQEKNRSRAKLIHSHVNS
jgi:hypothetical protein